MHAVFLLSCCFHVVCCYCSSLSKRKKSPPKTAPNSCRYGEPHGAWSDPTRVTRSQSQYDESHGVTRTKVNTLWPTSKMQNVVTQEQNVKRCGPRSKCKTLSIRCTVRSTQTRVHKVKCQNCFEHDNNKSSACRE